MRLFRNSFFLVRNWVFSICTNNFLNTFRNFDIISSVNRFIRIFYVIAELYCILLRRRRKIKKAFAFVSARYIRTFEAFPEHERHPCGVSKRRLSHLKKVLSIPLNYCAFWTLDLAPTLDDPVLLKYYCAEKWFSKKHENFRFSKIFLLDSLKVIKYVVAESFWGGNFPAAQWASCLKFARCEACVLRN